MSEHCFGKIQGLDRKHITAVHLVLASEIFPHAVTAFSPMRQVDTPEKDNGFQTITNGLAADVKPCKVSA